jgi:L-alanine-DL-glutamate epimerase-like enolase superfamily enzyme
MKLITRTFLLKLKHPFTISRGTRTSISSLIVELRDGNFSGYGEATANPYYKASVAEFELELHEKRSIIENPSNLSPEAYWMYLYPHFLNNMFLLCALDEAYHDLIARKKGIKLFENWKSSAKNLPKSSYTIGIDSIEKMILKMKATTFPIYKIKLGTNDDIKIITELRKHTDAVFRIDANCGWTCEETVKNAEKLKNLGVEFIEQPLPANDWEGASHVYKHSCLPIMADESCIISNDVLKCVNHFHGVNIKLMKCGGLTPAIKMIKQATSLGLKTMIGCMTESTVGISAMAHIAPLVDYADLDGALLIKNDIAMGVTISNGTIQFPEKTGSGTVLLFNN